MEVDSGDEFEDLADAFNSMSNRLLRQFRALATNAGIHRAVLSSLDTPTIVETAVVGGLEAVDADIVGIALRTGEMYLFNCSDCYKALAVESLSKFTKE